ncbi:hypothetical protein ACFQ3N_01270 [Virgibacillus byunsanensis]|uniref:Uncharacterized protein n=1 Tax=Virgibacillus byunsanensis TaxID=570945 RepID=A0ABW3LH76_9BACI
MSVTLQERSKYIKDILNGTFTSLKTVVPINHNVSKPKLLENHLAIPFGVLIRITGDIKGKLILAGNSTMFASIGETMFGMTLKGEQ